MIFFKRNWDLITKEAVYPSMQVRPGSVRLVFILDGLDVWDD